MFLFKLCNKFPFTFSTEFRLLRVKATLYIYNITYLMALSYPLINVYMTLYNEFLKPCQNGTFGMVLCNIS